MNALLKRYSFIAYILIGQLICLPAPALARSKQAVTAVEDMELTETTQAAADSTELLDLKDSPKLAKSDNPSPTPASDLDVKLSDLPKDSTPPNAEGTQEVAPLTYQPQSAPQGKLKLVVLELNDDQIQPKVVEKVTDTLRDELSNQERFYVVPKTSTRAFFLSNPNLMQRIDVSNPLNRYLEEAKEFYKTSYFKEASGVLSNTIDTYRSANPPMNESFLIVDAYLMLGNIYLVDKNKRDAKNSFKEAVRLDPDRELTQRKFSPETISKYIAAKEEYLSKAKSSQVDVYTSPKKAEVYINGVHQGTSPVKMDRFTQGEHFILAKKPGYKPMAKKINIKSNYQRVKIDLEKDTQASNQTPGLNVQDLGNVDEQVRMAGKVGNMMNADKVVLVSVREVGYNNKITARMIDMKYYASHKPKSVEVLNLPKDTRSAANVISQDLVTKADLDIGKNPKKYADSEVIVIGKKKKKSILKSPWLWGLLGAAVVGGATGAVLLTRGGGDSAVDDNGTTVGVSGPANRAP